MGAETSLLFINGATVTEVGLGYDVYFAFLSSPLFDSVAGTCMVMGIAEPLSTHLPAILALRGDLVFI